MTPVLRFTQILQYRLKHVSAGACESTIAGGFDSRTCYGGKTMTYKIKMTETDGRNTWEVKAEGLSLDEIRDILSACQPDRTIAVTFSREKTS